MYGKVTLFCVPACVPVQTISPVPEFPIVIEPVDDPQVTGEEEDEIDIVGLLITLIVIVPGAEVHPEPSVYVAE